MHVRCAPTNVSATPRCTSIAGFAPRPAAAAQPHADQQARLFIERRSHEDVDLVCATSLMLIGSAWAQQPTGAAQVKPDSSSAHSDMADKDYMAAMAKMDQAMMAAKDADPDRAFALKMIEHHRGGIAMSELV